MKTILLILSGLFPILLSAQDLPGNDDYLMVSEGNTPEQGNYIFRNSKKIFFGYHLTDKKAETKSKGSAERIRDLFKQADSIDFAGLSQLPAAKVESTDTDPVRIIEYRKQGKLFRVQWRESDTTKSAQQLNELLSVMNGFW
jgi:hypothetical protein